MFTKFLNVFEYIQILSKVLPENDLYHIQHFMYVLGTIFIYFIILAIIFVLFLVFQETQQKDEKKEEVNEEPIKETVEEVAPEPEPERSVTRDLEDSISHQKSHQNQILKYLTEKFGGNVHTKHVVEITVSSIWSGPVENIVKEDDNKWFGTYNEPDSWIKFDFKERKVLLDRYTLKTVNDPKGSVHLKNWVLEVSDDDNNFTEIDKHKNCRLLNGPLRTKTFEVSHSTPARFVRLRQIGENWHGNNYLLLNQIEFSGFVCE